MENFIVGGIILLIIVLAVVYIIREKKNGVKCIGCPAGCNCKCGEGGSAGCCEGCHSHEKK